MMGANDGVHYHTLDGLRLETGDLICTIDGADTLLPGQFWRFIGKLIPGAVDHIVVYVGPGGRCVEAGARGKVIAFDVPGDAWDSQAMFGARRMLDKLYGVAYPLRNREIGPETAEQIRIDVARYCLRQATDGKPYNLNFLDSETEEAFYCSQLAYKAYARHGIDLNPPNSMLGIPGTGSIVFPQEIWDACEHQELPEG